MLGQQLAEGAHWGTGSLAGRTGEFNARDSSAGSESGIDRGCGRSVGWPIPKSNRSLST